MDILGVSTWFRYLQLCGEELPFPSNGYRGEYVHPLAQRLRELEGERLRAPAATVLAGLPAMRRRAIRNGTSMRSSNAAGS